jgi:hypothetical protein
MIEDFNNRWGDGSDLLMFKYGQTGSGKGQPCGHTPEQIYSFHVILVWSIFHMVMTVYLKTSKK